MTTSHTTTSSVDQLKEALEDIRGMSGWTITQTAGGCSVNSPRGAVRVPRNLDADSAQRILARLNAKGYDLRNRGRTRTKPATNGRIPEFLQPEPDMLAHAANDTCPDTTGPVEHPELIRQYPQVRLWELPLPLPPREAGFVSRYVLMTPERAEELLALCDIEEEDRDGHLVRHNRALSEVRATDYGLAMEKGLWKLGQGLFVDWEGKLRDGRTRLNAVALSRATVPMHIHYNRDPAEFAVYDSGRIRSGRDFVSVSELGRHSYPGEIYSSGRLLFQYLSEKEPRQWGNVRPTKDEVLAFICRDHPDLPDCVAAAARVKTAKMLHRSGAVGLYLARQAWPEGPHEDFVIGVATGDDADGNGLLVGDPRKALNRFLRFQRTAKEADHHLALYLKAWRDFVLGGERQVAMWRSGEPMPKAITEAEVLKSKQKR